MNALHGTSDHRNNQKFAVLIITTVVLYLAVRLLDLNHVVTTDEPFWLGRSANFYRALMTGELEYTYQMAHPGVMTMWAGAFAYFIKFPEYVELAAGNTQVPYGIEHQLRSMGQDPLELMVAAKISKIVLQTGFFTLSMVFLPRIIQPTTAIVSGFLIAFSPMMTGFDSALHVDGLFTTICFAAIVIICWASFRPTESLE